eukprot:3308492-Amphidinium_carterae.2
MIANTALAADGIVLWTEQGHSRGRPLRLSAACPDMVLEQHSGETSGSTHLSVRGNSPRHSGGVETTQTSRK